MFDMELEPWIPGDIMTIGLAHNQLEEDVKYIVDEINSSALNTPRHYYYLCEQFGINPYELPPHLQKYVEENMDLDDEENDEEYFSAAYML